MPSKNEAIVMVLNEKIERGYGRFVDEIDAGIWEGFTMDINMVDGNSERVSDNAAERVCIISGAEIWETPDGSGIIFEKGYGTREFYSVEAAIDWLS